MSRDDRNFLIAMVLAGAGIPVACLLAGAVWAAACGGAG